VIVRGRVQGVGFRYFVVQQAQARELVGWVRNLGNGDVEAWAEGPRPQLEDFLDALRQGPPLARVQSATPTWGKTTNKFRRFSAVSTAW
jgi:acylphosphatase